MSWTWLLILFSLVIIIIGMMVMYFYLKRRAHIQNKLRELQDEIQRIDDMRSMLRSFYNNEELEAMDNEGLQTILRILTGQNRQEEILQSGDQRAIELLKAVTEQQQHFQADNHPHRGDGTGIVLCAGGPVFGPCAYIVLRRLRTLGCMLPVEVWHYGPEELTDAMRNHYRDFEPLEFKDIQTFNGGHKLHNIYSMKPLAIYYSRFRHILYLDADNLPLRDPSYLLEYEENAVFWPDHWTINRKALAWSCLPEETLQSMRYISTQESCQLVIHKDKCMKALDLCVKINIQLHKQLTRLFPEPNNGGDKDTWHFSWLVTQTKYLMISHRPASVGFRQENGVFRGVANIHYDVENNPLFLHNLVYKWDKWTERETNLYWKEIHRFVHSTKGRVDPHNRSLEEALVEITPFKDAYPKLTDELSQPLRDMNRMHH